MTRQDFTSEQEANQISEHLRNGRPDEAFCMLADYLKRNNLSLSDDVLRTYIEHELFECFTDRSALFETALKGKLN